MIHIKRLLARIGSANGRAVLWLLTTDRGRHVLALAAFGIVLYLFWPLIGELREVAGLFRRASWVWLLAAVIFQFLSYVSLTALNDLLLKPFRGEIGFWRLMAVLPAMAFIEIAVPSAGASGILLRARLLGRRGYTAEASTFTLVFETILLVVVTVAASASGIWYLIRGEQLGQNQLEVLGALALAALLLGASSLWAGRERSRLERWLQRLLVGWSWLLGKFRRPPYPPAQLTERLDRFYEGLARLQGRPYWPLWLTAIGRVAFDIATLAACFAAFDYPLRPGVLLTGYGAMISLSLLAALPGGLGLADASLAIIYARLGAPGAVAVAASLSYRLIAFWLLRLIGFACWQALELDRQGTRTGEPPQRV